MEWPAYTYRLHPIYRAEETTEPFVYTSKGPRKRTVPIRIWRSGIWLFHGWYWIMLIGRLGAGYHKSQSFQECIYLTQIQSLERDK